MIQMTGRSLIPRWGNGSGSAVAFTVPATTLPDAADARLGSVSSAPRSVNLLASVR